MRRRGASSGDDFPLYPIVPVIEALKGVTLGFGEGRGWTSVRCPFHPDSDASASINTTLQVFNCHADDCPTGTATQIIMQWEQVSYAEAKQRAETISGASLGNVQPAPGRRGRMAGGTRSGSGVRSDQRTWRRPGRSSGS